MAGKIASSIFSSGAKDELLAVDVYAVKDSLVKNNIVESTVDFGSEVFDTLRNDPGAALDLARIVSVEGSGIGLDKAALTDRIISVAGSVPAFNKLTNAAKGTMVSGLEKVGIKPSTSIGVMAVVGEVVGSVRPGDITDARGIADILGRITGNPEVAKILDLEAEAALFGSIFSEAMRLGIPDAIDLLIEKASADETVRRFLQDNLLTAVTMCDLKSVRRIVDKIGRSAALAQVPNIVILILTFYFYQDEADRNRKAAVLAELVGLLDYIQPEWYLYNGRPGEDPVTKIGVFSYASEDAIDLFMSSPRYQTEIMIAGLYPTQDLMGMTQQMYPYALF